MFLPVDNPAAACYYDATHFVSEVTMSPVCSSVLSALLSADAPVSGTVLASNLNITRAAVWKAVQTLRNQGHPILGSPRTGYRLLGDSILSPEGILRFWPSGVSRPELTVLDTVDSTNAYAKTLAQKGAPAGLAVVSRAQTSGHGRYGRPFDSPENAGLYLSLLLRPDIPLSDAALLTVYASVVTARAVEAQLGTDSPSVRIKWVNDLQMSGKKICGILTEAAVHMESGSLDYAVVGIGINLFRRTWPEELSEVAGDIETLSGRVLSPNRLAADILSGFSDITETGLKAVLPEYRDRSVLLDRDILVFPSGNTDPDSGKSFPAHVIGIDDRAGLI
ncbi:MAG: biotin--[acetyl-CoA-carboxylase] ligase, partial [Clostridia bacterium]|nr:biotin--[acetyl-CoA-carboxylase] ligase [Clostridia bacterium]